MEASFFLTFFQTENYLIILWLISYLSNFYLSFFSDYPNKNENPLLQNFLISNSLKLVVHYSKFTYFESILKYFPSHCSLPWKKIIMVTFFSVLRHDKFEIFAELSTRYSGKIRKKKFYFFTFFFWILDPFFFRSWILFDPNFFFFDPRSFFFWPRSFASLDPLFDPRMTSILFFTLNPFIFFDPRSFFRSSILFCIIDPFVFTVNSFFFEPRSFVSLDPLFDPVYYLRSKRGSR